MSDITASITNFAAKNEELLTTLQHTDYAEAALKQQDLYIKDLENELDTLRKTIRDLELKTKVEKKEFEELRDSNFRRFAHKLGGSKGKDKFASKSEKEEREYYEALEKERSAKDRKASLEQALQEGNAVRENYKRDSDTHLQAQSELDNLYNMVFAGPTPSFPHEDQSEYQFTQARERFNGLEQNYRANYQACEIFDQARKHIAQSARLMDDARSASQWDMFGGGMMADHLERSSLASAASEAQQVRGLVLQAQRVYPQGVKDIPDFEIAQGNIMSDMLFDNIFTDMAFHDKIKSSQAQILRVQQDIEQQFSVLDQQIIGKKDELDRAQADLTNARKTLQDTRSQIFSQVGGQPPAYQA